MTTKNKIPNSEKSLGFFVFVSIFPLKKRHINKLTLDVNNLTNLQPKNLLSLQRKYRRLNEFIFVVKFLI